LFSIRVRYQNKNKKENKKRATQRVALFLQVVRFRIAPRGLIALPSASTCSLQGASSYDTSAPSRPTHVPALAGRYAFCWRQNIMPASAIRTQSSPDPDFLTTTSGPRYVRLWRHAQLRQPWLHKLRSVGSFTAQGLAC